MNITQNTDGGIYHAIDRSSRGVQKISSRYYEVTHDLRQGGAISGIRLLHAGPPNLFLATGKMEIGLACGEGYLSAAGKGVLAIKRRDDGICLRYEQPLLNAEKRESGIILRAIYDHGLGHIRIRQELFFPRRGVRTSWIKLQNWTLHPSLTHFGVRPGAPAETSPYPNSMGQCEWGRFAPGRVLSSIYASRHVPRYACFADPGRYGIEWFTGSQLDQWDYQLTGRSGNGSLCIAPATAPESVVFVVCPLDLPRGGVTLAGKYVFDSFIGIPLISDRANRLFLHDAFNRKSWPTADHIATWAQRGIDTVHFHHDGDYGNDGIFWRDGTYPPFGPADMREFDRVIADCHRRKIRVTTYFSNKELYPSTPVYKRHGREWARLPDDRGKEIHNLYGKDEFGVQMCLRSGWLDFFKEYVDKVLSHHDLDGVYYDWNLPLYCANPHASSRHCARDGIGAQANSPIGHWDVEELLDVMHWTRQRVGSGGQVIVHNTMTPMAAMENYADYVVAMEWGYAKLALGVPSIEDLPLELNFMGGRPRGIITGGCVEAAAGTVVRRQWMLRCLLAGMTPWCADDMALEIYAPLAGRDLSRYTFHDWRSGMARSTDPALQSVVYSRRSEALVVVANLAGARKTGRVRLDLTRAKLAGNRAFVIESSGKRIRAESAEISGRGVWVTMPADSAALLKINPLRAR